jgi:short-subunit dehydrogenase
VNNAGTAQAGRFAAMSQDAVVAMIDVNVRALTALTRAVLPGMLERKRGKILNIASVASFQPVPAMAVYAATKAYVLSFTEALAEELAKTGVTATALCPGLTNTPLVSRIGATEVPTFAMLAPAEVAREGFDACMSGEVIRTPGITNRLTTTWMRYQPRWLVRRMAGMVSRFALDY